LRINYSGNEYREIHSQYKNVLNSLILSLAKAFSIHAGCVIIYFKTGSAMTKEEFLYIRHLIGKSQSQMARVLGCSLKAIQSIEQGWRNIPMYIERQTLFLLHMKRSPEVRYRPCWTIEECPEETRRKCPAWEFKAGHICWFINGTICHGDTQAGWKEKMEMCRHCKVFRAILPSADKTETD